MQHDFPVPADAAGRSYWLLLAQKDTQATTVFYKQGYRLAYEHLRLNGCEPARLRSEAMEVAQTAFVRMLVYVPRHQREQPVSPEALLSGFIRNVWYDQLRERMRNGHAALEGLNLEAIEDDTELVTAEKLAADRVQDALFAALKHDLKSECRTLIDLAYLQDRSHRAIGEQIKRSAETVKKQLMRCRRYLLAATKLRLEGLEEEGL